MYSRVSDIKIINCKPNFLLVRVQVGIIRVRRTSVTLVIFITHTKNHSNSKIFFVCLNRKKKLESCTDRPIKVSDPKEFPLSFKHKQSSSNSFPRKAVGGWVVSHLFNSLV